MSAIAQQLAERRRAQAARFAAARSGQEFRGIRNTTVVSDRATRDPYVPTGFVDLAQLFV